MIVDFFSNKFFVTVFRMFFLFTVYLILSFAQASHAADQVVSDKQTIEASFSSQHRQWKATLEMAERKIAQGPLNDEIAASLREEINKVLTAANRVGLSAEDKSAELKKLSDSLGPLPKEGEPQETPEVAYERRKIERLLREVEGQVKQSDLVVKRSDILLHQISTVEIDQIVETLEKQDLLPLDPRNWIKAGGQFFRGYKALITAREGSEYRSPVLVLTPVLLIAVIMAIVAGLWVRRRLFRNYPRNETVEPPAYSRKVIAALMVGFSRGVVPVLVVVIICGLAWNYGLREALDPQFSWPRGVFYAALFYLFVSGMIRAIFSPSSPQWNLTWVAPEATKKMVYLLNMLTILFALGIAFEAVLLDTGKAVEFSTVYAFIKNSLISLVLLAFTRKSLWVLLATKTDVSTEQDRGSGKVLFWPYLRFITATFALTALVCSLLGFHNLAGFILPRIILTNIIAAVFVSIRVLIRELLSYLLEKDTNIARSIRTTLAFEHKTGNRISFWFMTFIDLFVILGAVYLLLILWKFPHQGLTQEISSWFTGISIGSYNFSLAGVLLAFLVLFGVLTLTRVIRSLLENRLLPQTNMDIGLRTAVSSGVGYVGVMIALLMSLSTLGIDLTKLALIAGALSVGIGFGLQTIVNNFVSGLVLLFERPIKIGDWVVVGNLEGKVKQINVRSTVIETFNRASVIIPNSDLLQTAVTNWTHKSTFGRVDIPVGVAYGTDIDQLETLLLEVAKELPEVMSWPAPYVLFLGFGDSSLDFQLYVYIDNIERRMRISSDIRKLVLKTFEQNGIEIPFPHRMLITPTQEEAKPANEGKEQK